MHTLSVWSHAGYQTTYQRCFIVARQEFGLWLSTWLQTPISITTEQLETLLNLPNLNGLHKNKACEETFFRNYSPQSDYLLFLKDLDVYCLGNCPQYNKSSSSCWSDKYKSSQCISHSQLQLQASHLFPLNAEKRCSPSKKNRDKTSRRGLSPGNLIDWIYYDRIYNIMALIMRF